ncbi:hypothetical protein GP2_013_00060 [Gordonia paraffinivorans NBRC 108238]|uniref:Uncharacterized protein n=1 Tax=Gordonia paraffinivorans NBRC 108238 TaxID=1223543 RepID=A0ABQ0IJ52_9ACTN|nr:hypothetical protein [Gordonia paraffinivorans]GAC83529.1 hypothetical protein GP2_013_00060 [Gordonia paraffinivorans NBRC 108238]
MSEHENPQPAEELETLETPPPAETPETDDTADADDTADTTPASSGGEAAKYRVQRNEARAALAEARTQIENLQRAAIEQLCAAAGVQPRALFTIAEIGDLVTEAGTVDHEAVAHAIDRARIELGIEIPRKGALAPRAGYQPANPAPTKTPWAEAFAPRNRRADR